MTGWRTWIAVVAGLVLTGGATGPSLVSAQQTEMQAQDFGGVRQRGEAPEHRPCLPRSGRRLGVRLLFPWHCQRAERREQRPALCRDWLQAARECRAAHLARHYPRHLEQLPVR